MLMTLDPSYTEPFTWTDVIAALSILALAVVFLLAYGYRQRKKN